MLLGLVLESPRDPLISLLAAKTCSKTRNFCSSIKRGSDKAWWCPLEQRTSGQRGGGCVVPGCCWLLCVVTCGPSRLFQAIVLGEGKKETAWGVVERNSAVPSLCSVRAWKLQEGLQGHTKGPQQGLFLFVWRGSERQVHRGSAGRNVPPSVPPGHIRAFPERCFPS